MKKLIPIYITIILLTTIPKTNNIDYLRTETNKIVGSLEISNLFKINLVQTTNNTYYLNHDINNNYDIKGTVFIDYRNNSYDKQINVYGHNSKTLNVPFKKLNIFHNKDYFFKENYILLSFNNIKRKYNIIALKEVNNDYEHMIINSNNHQEHINKLLKNTKHLKQINYTNNTNIIIIQTCSLTKDNTYILLIGIQEN